MSQTKVELDMLLKSSLIWTTRNIEWLSNIVPVIKKKWLSQGLYWLLPPEFGYFKGRVSKKIWSTIDVSNQSWSRDISQDNINLKCVELLSNIMLVIMKYGQVKVCIDYCDLNLVISKESTSGDPQLVSQIKAEVEML